MKKLAIVHCWAIMMGTPAVAQYSVGPDDVIVDVPTPGGDVPASGDVPGVGGGLSLSKIFEGTEDLSGSAPTPGDVPVDGGLSLLLAAGAAYGARRVRRRRDVH